MISRRFYKCYVLVFAAFSIAAGCCCKSYDQPYTTPAPTPGSSSPSALHAGVAKIEITSENGVLLEEWDGVPLAGWGGRHLIFPDLDPFNYHTYLKPSEGIKDPNRPLWAKSLVIDNGSERVCIVTVDAIGSDGKIGDLAHRKAAARGFSIPIEKVLFCASHTHSGPGAMTNKRLWAYVGSDLCVDRVRERFTDKIADSMVKAEQNMVPVRIGIGSASLTGVTENRRGDISPYFDKTHIDDQLGIISVDKVSGTALATVWNYAIHGTIYGADNLKYSPDIMGEVSALVEQNGGGIALFINGSEGDIKPHGSLAHIATTISSKIIANRPPTTTPDWLELKTAYEIVNFGNPQLDATGPRLYNTISGELDIVAFLDQYQINPGMAFTMSSSWVENEFRFQAIRIGETLLSSVPGEPIYDIGLAIRNEAVGMGYTKVFICSLANNHMGYVTTSQEYAVGYYEALVTLFGPTTGENVINACKRVAEAIRP
jgi:hypothetical protein